MREHKYKVWDKENKRMIYLTDGSVIDNYCLIITSSMCCVEFDNSEDGIKYLRDIIPLQYTGLKDKNGKEIYEGDVVKDTYPNALSIHTIDSIFCNFIVYTYVDIDKMNNPEQYLEVIGNIYENPELIKEV